MSFYRDHNFLAYADNKSDSITIKFCPNANCESYQVNITDELIKSLEELICEEIKNQNILRKLKGYRKIELEIKFRKSFCSYDGYCAYATIFCDTEAHSELIQSFVTEVFESLEDSEFNSIIEDYIEFISEEEETA